MPRKSRPYKNLRPPDQPSLAEIQDSIEANTKALLEDVKGTLEEVHTVLRQTHLGNELYVYASEVSAEDPGG